MPNAQSPSVQVKAYLAALQPDARRYLQVIRRIVREVAPDATESFSYRMPGFRLDDRVFLYYAGFKDHVSLFPMTAEIRARHAGALKGYRTSAGTVQFPLDKPLSLSLVKGLIKTRMSHVRMAAARKNR
jgi:uncharacterized protein YdhG (YjbR/CyaY superfamily)